MNAIDLYKDEIVKPISEEQSNRSLGSEPIDVALTGSQISARGIEDQDVRVNRFGNPNMKM
jgi:hypothetical protein